MSRNFVRVVRSMTDTQFERFYTGIYRRIMQTTCRDMRVLYVTYPGWWHIVNACMAEFDRRGY